MPVRVCTMRVLMRYCRRHARVFARFAAARNAASETGRLFLTGQVQGNNWDQTAVKNKACAFMGSMFSCNALILSVQTYQDFASSNTAAPALYDNNGNAITTWPFNYGTQGQIMVVQLVYPWSVVSGPLGFSIGNLPNKAAEMMGVAAFRVEPY